MTVTYGFYDSLNGDRKYNALQLSQLFKGIITDGIFQSIGQGFVVGAPGLMTVAVGSGRAWFNDRWIDNDASIILNVLASEAVLNRIDTVVIEINSDIATRANSLKVIKGTPATTPVAPTMANTSTLHQYPLANIYVAAGVTSINPGNITNRIGMAGGTPFITGVLTSFDVSTLFGQFESNFQNWFDNLVDQLSGSQVANLQAEIDALNLQNTTGWVAIGETWTYGSASTINVPSNATLKYQKGMPIRWKQGGGFKYGNIIAVAPTELTIAINTDYVLTNATITDISVSFISRPFGFPEWFNRSTAGILVGSGTAGSFATSYAFAAYRINGTTISDWSRFVISNVGSWTGTVTVLSAVPAIGFNSNSNFRGGVWANGVAPGTKKADPISPGAGGGLAFVSQMGAALLQWSSMAANDEIQISGEYQF